MRLTSEVSLATFLFPELINKFYLVGKEMSDNSEEEISEDPMPQEDEKDEEGIISIAWEIRSIYNESFS